MHFFIVDVNKKVVYDKKHCSDRLVFSQSEPKPNREYVGYIGNKSISKKQTILQGWAEIDVAILESMITSMPTRIFEVIRRNGCHIKY